MRVLLLFAIVLLAIPAVSAAGARDYVSHYAYVPAPYVLVANETRAVGTGWAQYALYPGDTHVEFTVDDATGASVGVAWSEVVQFDGGMVIADHGFDCGGGAGGVGVPAEATSASLRIFLGSSHQCPTATAGSIAVHIH